MCLKEFGGQYGKANNRTASRKKEGKREQIPTLANCRLKPVCQMCRRETSSLKHSHKNLQF